MTLKRLILVVAALILLAALVWAGSGLASGVRGQAGTPTPEAEGTPVAVAVRARAEVVPVLWADLSFDGAGTVAEWFVAEGDLVAAGTPLGRLATPDEAGLERTVAQAEIDLRQAELEVERRGQELLEAYKAEAVRTLGSLANANVKGLLRRTIGKIFNELEFEGWCDEFEARNAASLEARAAATG